MDYESVATSGYRSTASTSGYGSTASTSGYRSTASTSGYRSTASTSGDRSTASTSGDRSTASTSGYGSTASTSGDGSIAAAPYAAEAERGWAIGGMVRLHPESIGAGILTDGGIIPVHPSTHPVHVWLTVESGQVAVVDGLLLPDDGRGYQLTYGPDGLYRAGCRAFTYREAVTHWSDPDHEAPPSASRLLAEVQAHHARTVGK